MKLLIWRAGLILFISAVLTAGVVSAACADRFIDRFDEDQDGVVTMDEFTGPARIFEEMDSDGDGVITEAEAAEAPGPGKGGTGFIVQFDQDGDSLVSLEEFESVFAELDVDQDGYISEDEAPSPPPPPHGERERSRE